MKKILVYSSLLTLCACGGGGGGSGVTGSAPIRSATTPEAITSNQEITQMASEILIANDGSENITRSATTRYNGKTYTSYRLDDVKFFTADQLNDTDSFLQLELDKNTGRIDAIQMDVGGVKAGRTVRSEIDTTLFEGPIFEYVLDGGDEAEYRVVDNGQNMAALQALETKFHLTGGHWNRIDERLDVRTLGGDIDDNPSTTTKLQYSDFGHFNPVYRSKNKQLTSDADIAAARAGTLNRNSDLDKYRDNSKFNAELAKEDYQLFAGGYAIEGSTLKDTLTPTANTTYSGKAIGRVYVSIESTENGVDKTAALAAYGVPYDNDANGDSVMDSYSNDAGHDISKAFTTSQATLTVANDGKQTLYMPFNTHSDTADKFYDVIITMNAAGNDVVGDPTYAEPTPVAAIYSRNTNPVANSIEGNVRSGFYGIDSADEAAGTIRYSDKEQYSGDNRIERQWEVQAAWGMKKDNP